MIYPELRFAFVLLKYACDYVKHPCREVRKDTSEKVSLNEFSAIFLNRSLMSIMRNLRRVIPGTRVSRGDALYCK